MDWPDKYGRQALTFDDVLLVPSESPVSPRESDARTHLTRHIGLNCPIVSVAVDTVTEAQLAVAIAREGEIGILRRCTSIEEQDQMVLTAKRWQRGKDPLQGPNLQSLPRLGFFRCDEGTDGRPLLPG